MKKYYILLFILLGTINLASAQKAGSIEYGLDFGLNSSYVQSGSDNTVQSDVVAGVNLGLSAEYYFSKFWGIKAKVIYDQKGWGNGYLTLGDQSYDHVDYQLNYITVPIMANWHFGYNRNWYLNFGIYEGFLLNATAGGYDVKSVLNSNDTGLAYGLGVKFPLSRKSAFFVEIDGQSGFSDISNNPSDDSLQSERASLNIGFNF